MHHGTPPHWCAPSVRTLPYLSLSQPNSLALSVQVILSHGDLVWLFLFAQFNTATIYMQVPMGFDPNPATVGAAGPGQGPLKSTLLFFHCYYFLAAARHGMAWHCPLQALLQIMDFYVSFSFDSYL